MHSRGLDRWTVGDLLDEVIRRGTSLDAVERGACQAALQQEGSIIGAARKLEITRHALARRITKHGLRKDWKV